MIGGFAEKELIRAIETTYYEAITALSTGISGSFSRREPDMIIYSSGIPMALLNGVIDPRFGASDLLERTEAAMSHFKKTGLPMRWVLGPSSTPSELGDFLLNHGFVSEGTTPGMAIDLRTVSRGPLPSGLEIQQVEDRESLRTCGDTMADGFEIPGNIRDGWRELIDGYGMSSTRRWFLGSLDGDPVAVSLLVLHEDVAGVYNIATIPVARRKGIGTAITREPLQIAKDVGYDVAVLEASEMGLPIYRRLGFKELCEFRTYVWSP
ncbi:MAG: GNAT family N-acetyltransferase [Methanomassiliicoccales archaeon]|nr:GNAT family N-acetyltransferase [Methanomassiliicoccales archaeon]